MEKQFKRRRYTMTDSGFLQQLLTTVRLLKMNDKDDVLPSFPAIRAKTLATLYPNTPDNNHDDAYSLSQHQESAATTANNTRDKSFKGSVDVRIRAVVDLINTHPCFATLSSCSGRTSLFDPHTPHGVPKSNKNEMEGGDDVMINSNQQLQQNYNNGGDQDSSNNLQSTSSGKGRGGWLLVSHEPLDPSDLVEIFYPYKEKQHPSSLSSSLEPDENSNATPLTEESSVLLPLVFKWEPMLLHVAAANLEWGRQLLQVALELGLRESGLIVTDKRVTVALRTASTSLTVPLPRPTPASSASSAAAKRPNHTMPAVSEAYLIALIRQANQQWHVNINKINALQNLLEQGLCRNYVEQRVKDDRPPPPSRVGVSVVQRLPDLRLWGHATLVSKRPTATTLLVFGGYGVGPPELLHRMDGKETLSPTTSAAGRSAHVYRLQRDDSDNDGSPGPWPRAWERVDAATLANNAEKNTLLRLPTVGGLTFCPAPWTARMGLAACVLPTVQLGTCAAAPHDNYEQQPQVVALFGGRHGPTQPLNELRFWTASQENDVYESPCFWKPRLDIQGAKPEPRWGHSLTAMEPHHSVVGGTSGMETPLALLVGGRNATTVMGTVHLLSLVLTDPAESGNDFSHLQWTQVDLAPALSDNLSLSRFHHAATSLRSSGIIVFGGLQQAQNVFQTDIDLGGNTVKSNALVLFSALCVAPMTCSAGDAAASTISTQKIEAHPVDRLNDAAMFGHAACSPQWPCEVDDADWEWTGPLICTGGLHVLEDDDQGFDGLPVAHPIRCYWFRRRRDEHSTGSVDTIFSAPATNFWHVHESHVETCSAIDNEKDESLPSADFGSLVHHRCAIVAAATDKTWVEMAIIGGGVPGFAFGPVIAKSYIVRLNFFRDNHGLRALSTTDYWLPGEKGLVGPNERSTASSYVHMPFIPKPPQVSSPKDEKTLVFYVHKGSAKTLKTMLENDSYLDKRFRMAPALASDTIAIPVTLQGWQAYHKAHNDAAMLGNGSALTPSWAALVVGTGYQVMSPSTSLFARLGKTKKQL